MRGVFSNGNRVDLFLMIFPLMNLNWKLVPVQYGEYRYGILNVTLPFGRTPGGNALYQIYKKTNIWTTMYHGRWFTAVTFGRRCFKVCTFIQKLGLCRGSIAHIVLRNSPTKREIFPKRNKYSHNRKVLKLFHLLLLKKRFLALREKDNEKEILCNSSFAIA